MRATIAIEAITTDTLEDLTRSGIDVMIQKSRK
eukprot:CAMPEP_0197012200 /NCGR_PEP_ID=MMETSP1380-20130617/61666_1 /TAXON_ID=5936 /ORGANISM="Euplotes crassus, Strain CT5" /LENGTH=32 /DNA_ID= /DNA_START= /DNA_END= /DNA_ORIENTATION=